jgi:hypothetical protein
MVAFDFPRTLRDARPHILSRIPDGDTPVLERFLAHPRLSGHDLPATAGSSMACAIRASSASRALKGHAKMAALVISTSTYLVALVAVVELQLRWNG